MGQRGPVPKRSDERVRRNAPEGPAAEKVTVIGTVIQPPLAFDKPHPLVVDMYHSLGQSAQAKFYEPSDWQVARLAMLAMQQMLTSRDKDGKLIAISAMKLQVLNQMFQSLLMTEGDRRRLNIEVDRNQGEGADVVDLAQVYRDRLAKQPSQ